MSAEAVSIATDSYRYPSADLTDSIDSIDLKADLIDLIDSIDLNANLIDSIDSTDSKADSIDPIDLIDFTLRPIQSTLSCLFAEAGVCLLLRHVSRAISPARP